MDTLLANLANFCASTPFCTFVTVSSLLDGAAHEQLLLDNQLCYHLQVMHEDDNNANTIYLIQHLQNIDLDLAWLAKQNRSAWKLIRSRKLASVRCTSHVCHTRWCLQSNNIIIITHFRYRIRGNFRGMKYSLNRKQTGFSRLYFHGSQVHRGKVACHVLLQISNCCKLAIFHRLNFRCISRWPWNPRNLHTMEISACTVLQFCQIIQSVFEQFEKRMVSVTLTSGLPGGNDTIGHFIKSMLRQLSHSWCSKWMTNSKSLKSIRIRKLWDHLLLILVHTF